MKRNIILLLAVIVFAGCSCPPKEEKVENIIFLIGDGMGLAQISALGLSQDFAPMQMERAAYIGLQKNYSANERVTDSAASGTALACGEKTNNGYLGVDPEGNPLVSSLEIAQESGRATALVTSTLSAHATPGAFYAKVISRDQYREITEQLIESGIDVIAGPGSKRMYDTESGREGTVAQFVEKGYNYAATPEDFYAIDTPPALLLAYGERFPKYAVNDSLEFRKDYLPRATAKTLELLEKTGKNGFFMMVEGSDIDSGGHENNIVALLGEMREFDAAVGVAFDYADRHPGTLVVVTADHETGGLSLISGGNYPSEAGYGVDFSWGTGDHSATFIPIFAYGTGAEKFSGVMENTDIAKKMKELLTR